MRTMLDRVNAEKLYKLFQEGKISSKEFKQRGRGYVIRSSGKRQYSKWTGADLRAIRAKNGVGRPPSVIASRRGSI